MLLLSAATAWCVVPVTVCQACLSAGCAGLCGCFGGVYASDRIACGRLDGMCSLPTVLFAFQCMVRRSCCGSCWQVVSLGQWGLRLM